MLFLTLLNVALVYKLVKDLRSTSLLFAALLTKDAAFED